MATSSEVTKENTIMYSFHVTASDECIHLTRQQLDHIPYLSLLVENKDKFLSCQHENGEYILNPPFQYNWFKPIFRSINIEQPYHLVTKVPEDENVVETIQLFDYLGIHLFSPPLLKEKYLVLSNPSNEKRHVEYHFANLSEARNTAAQFIISISKNEYDLYEIDTLQSVYDLLVIIFSNKDVFSARFRHHTLTIMNECCRTFFSAEQLFELPTIEEIAESSTTESWIYLSKDDRSLPETFNNAFAWKSVYKLAEKNDTNIELNSLGSDSIDTITHFNSGLFTFDDFLEREHFEPIEIRILFLHILPTINHLHQFNYWFDMMYDHISSSIENRSIKKEYISEAKSARSKRFNTLPKRPTVDKFKHRFAPKAQKRR